MSARPTGPPGKDRGPGDQPEPRDLVDHDQVSDESRVPRSTVWAGRVTRSVLRRDTAGGCLVCSERWDGPSTFLWASEHTDLTGHATTAGRTVVYGYSSISGAR